MKQEKDKLEELKKYSSNTTMLIAFVFFSVTLITLLALSSRDSDATFFIFSIWIMAIIFVVFVVNDYQYRFKDAIIAPFVESKGLRYLPRNMIDKMYIKESRLIRGYDSIDGSDLIFGDDFVFSHIMATEHEEDDDGHTKTTVIFDGLFYKCKLPKNMNINGNYFVNKTLINLDGLFPPIFNHRRIRLDHREFEYLFNVRGDDHIEGRYIFDHNFMEKLLSVYDKYEFDGISIVNGYLYIAFPGIKLVEVPLGFSDLYDEKIEESKNRILYFASLRDYLFHKYVEFEKILASSSSLKKAQ